MFLAALELLVYFKILKPVYDLTNQISNPKEINYAEFLRRSTTKMTLTSSTKGIDS